MLIDLLVVLGVAVVLPLALGGPTRWWAAAAVGVGASFLLPRGLGAAVLVLPWLAVAAQRTLAAAKVAARPGAGPRVAVDGRVLAAGYATFAAGSLIVSRLGLEPLHFREPIIELTAIHYTYAGAAALTLALATRPGRLADAAVLLTAAAPPIVALGFFTRSALPQVGGAVLMTLGVWATGLLHLRRAARRSGPRGARALLAVSGLAVWAPMVLAVAWAAGQHWSIPILSVPDMARTHGVANAVAFCLCGLLGRRALASQSQSPAGRP